MSAIVAPPDGAGDGRRRLALVTLAVFASLVVYSALRAPVPGDNEPHYLGKAKHYWDASWCTGDFFLQTVDAHPVFYFTMGWLTRFLTLEQTAWVGRVVALAVVAVGWIWLLRRLAPGTWTPLYAAWLFLLLAAVGNSSRMWAVRFAPDAVVNFEFCNLSHEWIVDGVEGKVFAYGWAFLSLAWACEQRWLAAAVTAGLSVSFHPVVGGWNAIAVVMAVCFGATSSWLNPRRGGSGLPAARRPMPIRKALVPLVVFVLASLPGIVPGWQLLSQADPKTSWSANWLQVNYRLKHHLNPYFFSATDWVSYLVMGELWWRLRRRQPSSAARRFFAGYVLAAILFSSAGLVVGLALPPDPYELQPLEGSVWLFLLKFYPFRLMDVMLPIALSIAVASAPTTGPQRESAASTATTEAAGKDGADSARPMPLTLKAVPFAVALLVALLLPSTGQRAGRFSPDEFRAWRSCCRWIRQHTPADAVFWVPEENYAFKWYAQRGEYVSYKDFPQDAPSIVEWNRRLLTMNAWLETASADGRFTRAELESLAEETGITHVVFWKLGPVDLQPLHVERPFRVYRLPAPVEPRRNDP